MDLKEFKRYCLNKKGVVETFPFDDETLVSFFCCCIKMNKAKLTD